MPKKGYKQSEDHKKKRFEDYVHPRGMLGKSNKWGKHSEKTKRLYSQQRKGIPKTQEHKEKIRLGNLRHGYCIKQGYKIISIHKKEFREHRMIWEEINGKIPEGFVIHHKDHNRSNNDIDNLELMSRSEHAKLHGKLRFPKGVKIGIS